MKTQDEVKDMIKQQGFIYGTALTIGNELNEIKSSNELLKEIWRIGIRAFDTSNNYANGKAEEFLGSFLSKKNRDEFIIFTKVGWPGNEYPLTRGLNNKSIMTSLNQSLNRLSLDHVDVYFAHRFDNEVPLLDIIKSFNNLIVERKINSWGISEWPIEITIETLELCRLYNLIPPVCEQFVFSYLIDDNEVSGKRHLLQQLGLVTLGYSPLAQGLLTGKYNKKNPNNSRIIKSTQIGYNKTKKMLDSNRLKLEKYTFNCKKLNLNPIQVALCWVKSKNVIPIIGLSNVSQISNITKFDNNYCTGISWNEINS
jgi:aryl-alcohol dehydrogenase-like predicted oxidoreductase